MKLLSKKKHTPAASQASSIASEDATVHNRDRDCHLTATDSVDSGWCTRPRRACVAGTVAVWRCEPLCTPRSFTLPVKLTGRPEAELDFGPAESGRAESASRATGRPVSGH
jgi:hypothetical protein